MRRQIDYILLDEIRAECLFDSGINSSFEGKSDHRAVFVSLGFGEKPALKRQRQKVLLGLSPKLDDSQSPVEYHHLLDEALRTHSSGSDPTTLVVNAAVEADSYMKPSGPHSHSPEVMALLAARRNSNDAIERKQLSKKVWRALRRQRRQRLEDELESMAARGSDIKALNRLPAGQNGVPRVNAIKDKSGEIHYNPDSICEVFAKFYEDLCRDVGANIDFQSGASMVDTHVTVDEERKGLKHLKNRRTAADDGLVAEMLKTCHAGLTESIAAFSTELQQGSLQPPAEWKLTKLKLLFKKNDPRLPENYRPISIIPGMAKLFSIVLYATIVDNIEKQLSEEQFGFRQGRGCADAVHVMRMVVEKSAEWGEELWVAALDVEKAFDRVHRSVPFDALLKCDVDAHVGSALRRMYCELSGYVVVWFGGHRVAISQSNEESVKKILCRLYCSIFFWIRL